MPRINSAIDFRLLSKVASLYYHQNYSQLEIANKLNLSRPKVSRLLKEARHRGIVRITVNYTDKNYVDLEVRLEEDFHLKEAIIVDIDPDSYGENSLFLKRQMGAVAANYLQRTITKGDVIGVTWGTTLQEMVESLRPQQIEDLHIVQLLGGVGPPEAKAHAADLSRRLAHLFYGSLTLLPAPGIASNPDSKRALLSDQQVRSAYDLFPKVTKAFVGIGSLSTNPVLGGDDGLIEPEVMQELIEKEAVGDISLRFFDRYGEPVKTSLQERLIGIELDQLKKIKDVVAIAGGKTKIKAIRGALSGGYIDVLITDIFTAKTLVKK